MTSPTQRLALVLLAMVAIAACNGNPVAVTGEDGESRSGRDRLGKGKAPSAVPATPQKFATPGPASTPKPAATPIEVPTLAPAGGASDAPAPTIEGDYTALVRDPAGKPVAGATVRGFLVDGDATPVVEGKTDDQGRFKLADKEGRPLNFEVVKADMRGFLAEVPPRSAALELVLAAPGGIKGKVTAPDAPALSDFSGVTVSLPGTPYTAAVGADGLYEIADVPAGTYSVVAKQAGLGQGRIYDVVVTSGPKTGALDLALDARAPAIASLSHGSGGPGFELAIGGSGFGSGAPLPEVRFGAVAAEGVKVIDDATIQVKVPPTAASGQITVKLGQHVSNAMPFKVLEELRLQALGTDVVKGRVQLFSVVAKDDAGATVAEPGVEWATIGPNIRVENGLVTGLTAGESTLRVASGTLSDQKSIKVLPFVANVGTLAGAGIAGDTDEKGVKARFNAPFGLLLAADGDLWVADYIGALIRRIKPDGSVTTVAGAGGFPGFAEGDGKAAVFAQPSGIALAAGKLYVADALNNRIRQVALAAPYTVSTRAGEGSEGLVNGGATAAKFLQPHGVAVDAAGALYVADTFNHCIRKIGADNQVTTFAGTGTAGFANGPAASAAFRNPVGLAFDAAGDLYVADQNNHCIRKIKGGQVTTFAGQPEQSGFVDGAAGVAKLGMPTGLAFDPRGNMLVSEVGNHAIRRIGPDGTVVTIAGSGEAGLNNGQGKSAAFKQPHGLAVGADGAIYVADKGNHVIRKITLLEDVGP